eukprot:8596676-Alexandrium_andersonii.AAC.1
MEADFDPRAGLPLTPGEEPHPLQLRHLERLAHAERSQRTLLLEAIVAHKELPRRVYHVPVSRVLRVHLCRLEMLRAVLVGFVGTG